MINWKNGSLLFLYGFLVSSISTILNAWLISKQYIPYFDYLRGIDLGFGFPGLDEYDVIKRYPYASQIELGLLNLAIFVIIELGGLILVYKLLFGKKNLNLSIRENYKFFLVSSLCAFISISIIPAVYYYFIYNSIYYLPRTGIKSILYWINDAYHNRTSGSQPSIKILNIIRICIGYVKKAIIDSLIFFLLIYFFKDTHKSYLDHEEEEKEGDVGSQLLYPSPSK